ncbi:Structural maintenance of chromosomes protein 3 [Borealophlyctis nickersoniae]|nr:Structural maintenance of chromosomes protein 3 [Borealophlyctis nickersoniae]
MINDFRLTGKEEVVLRRTIGQKKDEYSLDKKSVTKAEVMSLLESAGFSRSNPYYIVPQGRITALTNAKDSERLEVLKEVAGTRVYEQRRQESLKIMDDTETKRTKIDELLEYIEDRLAELEEEKKELKEFQDQDHERRRLEYTIYSREQNEVNESLEVLENARRNEVDESNQRQRVFNDRARIISDMEQEIRSVQQKVEMFNLERAQLEEDRQEQSKAKAHLELIIGDLEDSLAQESETKKRLISELRNVDEAIGTKEHELRNILPSFEDAVVKERELKQKYEQADIARNSLYAKQGRHTRFRTQAERDKWLRKEIDGLRKDISTERTQIEQVEQELVDSRGQLEELSSQVADSRKRLESRRGTFEEIDKEIQDLKAKRNELDEKRKELWREEAKSSSALETCQEELQKCERMLLSSMDRNTSNGIQAVRRVVAREKLAGVYGALYELFDVDDRYRTAVEVVAGGRLKPKEPRYPTNNKEAVVMLKKLHYDETYHKAFLQVFGKAIICPDLEIASSYARSMELTAVTLDGDRADRKGALTGGFHDQRASRLENIKNMKTWRRKLNEEKEKVHHLKQESQKVDQQITGLRDRINQLEGRKRQLSDSRDPLMGEINAKTREEANLKDSIALRERSLESLQSTVRNNTIQLQAYEAELSTPLAKTLSSGEQQRLEELTSEIEALQQELSEAATSRATLEREKTILESELNENLRRRRNELSAELESMMSEGQANLQLQGRRQELLNVERAIETAVEKITTIDEELDEASATIRERNQSLEKAQAEQVEAQKDMQKQQRVVEHYLVKRSRMLEKKEMSVKSIRDLGLLPDGAFDKYKNTSTKKLMADLHKVKESLKKFSHVNKKAIEQYQNFTKQRTQLDQRKEELDNSASAIEDLIQNLDQRKDEAIERTFKQVAKYFADVWEKLVPAGRGSLIMLRRADGSNEDSQDLELSDEDSGSSAPKGKGKGKGKGKAAAGKSKGRDASVIDQYTGVAIQVSFNSKTDEGLRMPQLSGGQKSLVALALIFAIQQCDPAPFYLFDEIDSALDAQYRTAVANMIHELSESAQFITTTFRPELLTHADTFYGVTFTNKVSKIQRITREDATEFVENQAPPQ